MAKVNVPLSRFNQGLISPESLARVDLARTDDSRIQFSAEVYTNWIPKTQGAMRLRPGTVYKGNILGDTGAYLIEFVAAADEVALLELTNKKMRIWQGTDAHNLSLLGRPKVDTTLTISDTGWYKAHSGPGFTTNDGQAAAIGHIPVMTGYTTSGVTISASSENDTGAFPAWRVADSTYTSWYANESGDTGEQWVKVDFGPGVTKQVQRVILYAPVTSPERMPKDFTLEYSSNDSTWTQWGVAWAGQTFASGEAVSYLDTGFSDTGSPSARYWRLRPTQTSYATPGANYTRLAEMRLMDSANAAGADTGQSSVSASGLRLNAGAVDSIARFRKALAVDTGDIGLEHSIDTRVTNGPVVLRIGTSEGDDDIVEQSVLGTGYHNISFTPEVSPVHITLQNGERVNRFVSTFSIGDTGTVEIVTPWGAENLDFVRHDQSADVVFVNSKNVQQHMIQRRGSDTGSNKGRSWSVVEYNGQLGPFTLPTTQDGRVRVNKLTGNVTIKSNVSLFRPGQVGQLLRVTHNGQNAYSKLGPVDSFTRATAVVGINDTGKNDPQSERLITFNISGTHNGTIAIERSFEAKEFGFTQAPADNIDTGLSDAGVSTQDTGTFNIVIRDPSDNETAYYRARRVSGDNGTAVVQTTARSGLQSGVYRVTNYNNNMSLDAETVTPASDTGYTDDWEIGEWSDVTGYPSAVSLHEGRLCHAGQASIYMSVSDDYTNFDDQVEGASAPISRTLGAGPVANIQHLTSTDILIAATADSELSIRSSSFDEVLSASNVAARRISTLGASNVRAVKRNKDIFFVNRSGKNLFRIVGTSRAEDSEPLDLTVLAHDVLEGGVVAMAIQREPDTRLHCVLADGTVAILTYEPNEELLAWSKWVGDTGTGAKVERAAVLPATNEDAVFYVVRRTINGVTKRYLEKWALENTTFGDSGICYLSDCSALQTDTGRNALVSGLSHLAGCSVVAWADDTGQTNAGKDLSPETAGVQTEYAVDTGAGTITLGEAVHHVVAGLPYKATWKSTKLAYGARGGTALTMMKRIDELGLVFHKTHNRGVKYGRDTGALDFLPLYIDEGARVDADKIFTDVEIRHVPFPGLWDSDSRVVLQASSPRPATVLAAVPHLTTNEH